jgi:hypothetical protein
MDETYRNLGGERNAEFERDALKWRRAAEVQERHLGARPLKAVQLFLARVAGLRGRRARAQFVRLPVRVRR